jgi:hypothetical protein
VGDKPRDSWYISQIDKGITQEEVIAWKPVYGFQA